MGFRLENTGNPVSLLPSIVSCPQNTSCQFLVAASDPDGQSLRFELTSPGSVWGDPVLIHPGPPHAPNAASIDPNTGLYTWDTTGATLRAGETLYSTQVTIYDLQSPGGPVASKSAIDFMIRLAAGNPPNFDEPPTPQGGTTFGVLPGQNLNFTVQASDSDVGDTVTINAIGLPPGATFNCGVPSNPTGCDFDWTPNQGDLGSINVVCFIASDNDGLTSSPRCLVVEVNELSTRKVIFLLGIDSEGYVAADGAGDCGAREGSLRRFNNLRAALAGVIDEDDFVWFSYINGDSGYCDSASGTYQKPRYNRVDTCDGIDEENAAAEELDRLVRKLDGQFPSATFDIVSHSMGGLVAAYWATGGTDANEWLTDDTDFLRDRIHSIITLDSPLELSQSLIPDAAIEFLVDLVSGSACGDGDPTDAPSWQDIIGGDLTVGTAIFDEDAQGANVLTRAINFVHIDSRYGSQLPGYWREDPAFCSGHSCMLDESGQLGAMRSAVRTNVYDDKDIDDADFTGTPSEWTGDPSARAGGWIRGLAHSTDNNTGDSVLVRNVMGSVIRVLYTGDGKATANVQVDGEEKGETPDKDKCTRYEHGHPSFFAIGGIRNHLCDYSVVLPDGTHTVEVTTIPDCPLFICNAFYFDAIEALPPITMRVEVRSPVNILVTDPDGRRIGFDPVTGIAVNEIPGATYSGPGSDPQIVQIPTMLPGPHEMLIIGTGDGDYHISIETLSEGGFVESTNVIEGAATEGSEETIEFDVDAEGVVTQMVDIDIKPGSDPNSINCNNEDGAIAVAILTTATFDATTVDHATVALEGASETHVDKKSGEPRRHEEDVDGDGDMDLVLHFLLGDSGLDFDCDSTQGTVMGRTFDGQAIAGTDAVRLIVRGH